MTSNRLWRVLATVLVLALLAWQAWPRLQSTEAPLGPTQSLPQAQLPAGQRTDQAPPPSLPHFLPAEAAEVIALIQRDGRFPHRQDGSVFGNREGRLPRQARGYYREYTVPTPGLNHRGARRIVTGGDPPQEWYYTADHYESFKHFNPPPAEDLQ